MKSAKCPECGFVGWADVEACKRCGAPIAPRSADQPVEQSAALQSVEQTAEYQTHYYPAGTNPFPEDLKTGWSVASLALGLANFLLLGIFLIPTVVGIVVSVVALKKIKRQPFQYGGKGMAIAGLVMNIVSVAVLIPILLIAAIAIPNLLASRRAANEGNAIRALTAIHSAEATYSATVGNGQFGTLLDLNRQNLIASKLAAGTFSGYRFNVEAISDKGDGLPGYVAVGVPTEYGSTGKRSFYIDETGVIRGGDMNGSEASKYDPPLRSDSEYSSVRSRRKSPLDEE